MSQSPVPYQPPMITEEGLTDAQPSVRALIVERLEQIWTACEPYILARELKPDPRYMETGVRVLDRLMRLYRLDSPQAQGADSDSGNLVDVRNLVIAQVAQLESRIKDSEG